MFNIKKDRRVVEVTIEFNITAIEGWLKAGAKFEQIDKIKRDWNDAVIQKYVIDMFPIGKSDNAYYHRNKGVLSQNIGGIDFLENADFLKNTGWDIEYIKERRNSLGLLEWKMWRGCLRLSAHKNLILITPPLTEVLELETAGTLSNGGRIADEDTKIKVTVSFDKNNNPKEFMNVWRGSNSDRSLGYGNALGHVSFSTLNFEVEY